MLDAMKSPVFVDVDTGVDDALALMYLFASPDADVVGIASSGGNVAVQQVCLNNLGLIELCGVTGVPVSKGSDETLTGPMRLPSKVHGPRGWGMRTCRRAIAGSPTTTLRPPGCAPRTPSPASSSAWRPAR